MRTRQLRQGIIIGILLLVCAWLLSLIVGLAGKARIAVTQAHEVQQQYGELEARKNALQASLNALDTPRGQDAAIRTAFGVAKPGEEVIVVVPPATTTATTAPPWWKKWIGWF